VRGDGVKEGARSGEGRGQREVSTSEFGGTQMAIRERRYWAIRTDKDNRTILLDEVQKGRLRQGWGYDSNQDLRIIQKEIELGGDWKERLSSTQKEAKRHCVC
jgi:hypothetical protein